MTFYVAHLVSLSQIVHRALDALASHSWPFGQSHQTSRAEPGVTSIGRSGAFLLECNPTACLGIDSLKIVMVR